jgi:tetratricopeptide (TPR) repeat protein
MVGPPDATNNFSGTSKAVVQAGEVHGGIHVHHTNRPFPPPYQLPLSSPGFVNREADLRNLDEAVVAISSDSERDRRTVVVSAVSGPPGVGKTAFAVHWAHRARDYFPDGVLYVDMQGFGPAAPLSPEGALDAFLRALDIPPDGIPEALVERAALFRSLLDGKRVLVLIDNVSSSAQARQLLPASRQCFAMVTSRNTLAGLVVREGAVRVTLDVLSPEESVHLLSELMGQARIDAEPSMALRVAELCGHLPLALRVVAESATHRLGLSLADLVEELVSEQVRLDALASTEDELSDTRVVFSWSYRALPPDLMRVFRILGLHAGPDMGIEAAAALTGVDAAVAKRQLRALSDVHLLQETVANRFRLHDLLKAYSIERVLAEETQEERTQAVRRVLSWYLLTADRGRRAILPFSPSVPLVPAGQLELTREFDDGPEAMRWFDQERRNLLAAMRQTTELGQFDIGWKLAVVVTGFFELRSYWAEWEENHRAGLAAAIALGDQFGEAVNLLMLGDVAWRLHRFDEATEGYERAAVLGHDLSVGWIEGFALRGQGLIQEEQGNVGAAFELYESSSQVFRSDGFRRGEGMSLLSLGKCARALDDPARAVAFGTEAVAIFEEINDTWTTAWGSLALATSLMDLNSNLDAMTHLRHAVDVFRKFADHRSEAQALVSLGEVLRRSGDVTEARTCWSRAAELYEALDDQQSAEIRTRLEELDTGG